MSDKLDLTDVDETSWHCSQENSTCEHVWDGNVFVSEDGLMDSASCSKCGLLAIEHDLRCNP